MKLKAPLQTFFMADEIKMELLNAQAVAGAHIDPAAHPDIPQEVDNYDSLVPLERSLPPNSQSKSIMGYQSTCYKATNKTDGTLCCLRRIHTIVFSFEYFPNAITLMAKHFNNPQSLNGFTNDFSGGARPFSSKGKYFATLRLRVNCVGVMDVLSLPNMDQATMMNYIQHWQEVENGRLARLVFKLCCILERPEFNMDPSWSETGDRYMLKLFRDYLFHQVDENGYPWMDVAHIVQSLNKLDAGVSEKVCLTTRDGQSIFVVSYAELKRFFASAFSELLNAGQPSGYT
nr:hypothetical protein BaRGS_012245 [Batillaria attramentaria]